MKFCPNCGAELKPEAKFCAACGTPIAFTPPPPVEPAPQQQTYYQQQEPVYGQAKEASNAFKEAISGKTNLVQRVINILTKPKEEWLVIANEQPNTMKLVGGYALILALIPARNNKTTFGTNWGLFVGMGNRTAGTVVFLEKRFWPSAATCCVCIYSTVGCGDIDAVFDHNVNANLDFRLVCHLSACCRNAGNTWNAKG